MGVFSGLRLIFKNCAERLWPASKPPMVKQMARVFRAPEHSLDKVLPFAKPAAEAADPVLRQNP